MSILGVEPGEGRRAGLMLAHSFAMGLATTYFETAASALFLARFGAHVIPWVYLAAAVLNTLTGVVYTSVQRRVEFARLMRATLLFLLVSVIALRAGLALADAPWLMFLLLVWYRVISALTDLEYWAVAGRIFDVREAKRLYGLIGSGEVVARIAGSFSVPLLVSSLGVANMLVVSAAGLLACLLLLALVMKGTPASAPVEAAPKGAPGAGLRAAFADRYLVLLFSLAFFGVLAKFFVDFAFLAQVKSRVSDASGLAAFFGVFSGVTQVLSLLARVFLSGPVLARHGIEVGLLVLPIAHALCTALLVLAGIWPGGGGAVFWLVIANQGVYKVLKHPIDNPSFKVLYQPLRGERRLAAQIAVETVVTPVAAGIAGAVMLLSSAVIPYDPVRFSYVLLLTFAGWVAVALRVGKGYAGALIDALKKRITDEDALSFGDERSIAVLRQALASNQVEQVLFALGLIEKNAPEQFPPLVPALLQHRSPAVRREALLCIERLRTESALDAVRRCASRQEPAPVRAAAIRALGAIGGATLWRELAEHVADADPQVRLGVTVALLRHGGAEGSGFALERLMRQAQSTRVTDRAWAARAIGDAGLPRYHAPLLGLLGDADAGVRRRALAAAGKVRAPQLVKPILAAMRDRRASSAALQALVAIGEPVLPELDLYFDTCRESRPRLCLVRALGRLGGEPARGLLLRRLSYPDVLVRNEVLESLLATGFQARDARAAEVRTRILAEAADAAWKYAVLRDLADAAPLVRDALAAELAASRRRLFLLLSFVLDARAILSARDNLTHASREKRAYAFEVLEVTLPEELRELLLPLFDDVALELRCQRLEKHFPQSRHAVEARLREVLVASDEWMTPWTRACVLYVSETLRMEVRESAGTLLKETAGWASEKQPDAARKGRPMLTIERVILLKGVDMFARAAEDDLTDVAAILDEREVKAGELIFAKGDAGDSMYIIVNGRVRVYDGERTITYLQDRQIFGELALLDPEPRVASIAAEEDTRLLRLDRDAFAELMAGNIDIVRGVLKVLCERLRQLTIQKGPYQDPASGAPPPSGR